MTTKKKPAKEITIRSSAAEHLTSVAATGDTANEHLKKIFPDSELSKEATIRNFRIVQTDIYAAAGDIGQEWLCLLVFCMRDRYNKQILQTLSAK
jgi:hypothetical protein